MSSNEEDSFDEDNGPMDLTPAAYTIGARVIKCGKELNFRAVVTAVIPPHEFDGVLETICNGNEDLMMLWESVFSARDENFHNFPMYIITPENCMGLATYEEARCIIPTMTKEQYEMIVGTRERTFLAIDSDLMAVPDEE